MRVARADPAADRQAAGGGGGGELEIALLNPNRYSEVWARRRRPWLAKVLAERLAEQPVPADDRRGRRGRRGLGALGALGSFVTFSMGVLFAGDRAMRRANREFRGKDQTTDVLSFSGADDDGGHPGDGLISVPQPRRQAAAAGRDPEREIQVLLLHGVLHCLGHDHEVDGGEMEPLERRLRRRWIGVPASTAASASTAAQPRKAGRPRGPRGAQEPERSRKAARRAG